MLISHELWRITVFCGGGKSKWVKVDDPNVQNVIRGDPNFDPVKNVKDVSHVKHMHANSILIHPYFSNFWKPPRITYDQNGIQ